jgi:hypothetical protein
MRAIPVEVPKLDQLVFEIHRRPEQSAIQKLSPN